MTKHAQRICHHLLMRKFAAITKRCPDPAQDMRPGMDDAPKLYNLIPCFLVKLLHARLFETGVVGYDNYPNSRLMKYPGCLQSGITDS
jgi:hypothetical protein